MTVEIIQGPHAGLRFQIQEGMQRIGRSPDADLSLALDQRLSRYHAALVWDGETLWIEDLGSTNGTFRAGERISGRVVLLPGVPVQVGSSTFQVQAPAEVGSLEGFKILPGESLTSSVQCVLAAKTGETPFPFPPNFGGDRGGGSAGQGLAGPPPDMTESEREAHRRLHAIQRLAEAIATQTDLQRTFSAIMDTTFEVLPAERGVLCVLDEETDELRPEIVRRRVRSLATSAAPMATPTGPKSGDFGCPNGHPDARSLATSATGEIAISQSIVDRVLEDHAGVLLVDAQSDHLFAGRQSIQSLGIRSALCVPLVYQAQAFGVLYVDTLNQTEAFGPADLELMLTMARFAALEIFSARMQHQAIQQDLQRRQLQSYLAPQVAERILSGDEPNVGRIAATVLYSDIRGFTPLSERMEPDALVNLINDYFDEMSRVIWQYDGTIDKYIGDAILAVFGSPLPDEHQVSKSVLAALRMQRNLAQWNERRRARGEETVRMGIGINYGEVVHGNIGTRELRNYTIMGDAVNVAARLQSLAGPEEVIISHSVYERVRDLFEIEPRTPTQVKGKEAPLAVYAVLGEKGERVGAVGQLTAYGTTDLGRVRTANEDTVFCNEGRRLFIVADGMGGRRGGAEASTLACRAIADHFQASSFPSEEVGLLAGGLVGSPEVGSLVGGVVGSPPVDSLEPANQPTSQLPPETHLLQTLTEALTAANTAIRAVAQETPELAGMGSTVVAAALYERTLYVAHVGDSRAYLLRHGDLELLTEDHSVPWVLFSQGSITADQLRRHPLRSVLTQCLGQQETVTPTIRKVRLQRADRVLLCTDGLWEMLTDKELLALAQGSATAEQTCLQLIDRANEHGGRDNITVIVIDVDR